VIPRGRSITRREEGCREITTRKRIFVATARQICHAAAEFKTKRERVPTRDSSVWG
jgi:hypothetical protein